MIKPGVVELEEIVDDDTTTQMTPVMIKTKTNEKPDVKYTGVKEEPVDARKKANKKCDRNFFMIHKNAMFGILLLAVTLVIIISFASTSGAASKSSALKISTQVATEAATESSTMSPTKFPTMQSPTKTEVSVELELQYESALTAQEIVLEKAKLKDAAVISSGISANKVTVSKFSLKNNGRRLLMVSYETKIAYELEDRTAAQAFIDKGNDKLVNMISNATNATVREMETTIVEGSPVASPVASPTSSGSPVASPVSSPTSSDVLPEREKGAFCGLNHSIIKAYLTPPKAVKDFIAFAFGIEFDIGLLNNSSQETCQDLGKVIGDVEVAWFGIDTPGFAKYVAPSTVLGLATGEEATKKSNHEKCLLRGNNEATCKEKEKEDKTEGKFATFYNAIPIPLCMAVRPCDVYGNNLFLDWTFGIRFGDGLTIYTSPGVNLALNQLTYSSSGHLTTKSFDEDFPPLLDVGNHTSWGMHVFIEVGMEIPLATVGGQPKFEVEGTGGLGILAKITLKDGTEIRSAGQFFGYFLETKGDFQQFRAKLSEGDQAFQSVEFELNVMLNGSIGLEFASLAPPTETKEEANPNMIKLHCAARAVIQVRVDKDGDSFFQFWSSFRAEMRLTDVLKGVPVIKDIVPAVDLAVIARLYGGIMGSGETDFIVGFRVSVKLQCGVLRDLITGWNTLMNGQGSASNSTDSLAKMAKMVGVVNSFLDAVCDKEHFVGIQLRIHNVTVDKQETFLEFNQQKLRLSDLPECNPPEIGIPPSKLTLEKAHELNTAKCSSNSDCFLNVIEGQYNPYKIGNYNGSEGYCLFDPSVKTSAFCLGRCVRKIEPGGSCSLARLNSPVNSVGFLDSATEALLGLDAACQSGQCICGTCAEFDGYAPIDASCAYSSSCGSGWCEGGLNKTTCGGVCRPKRKNGEAAWQSDIQLAPSCESKMQLCGTCVQGYGGVPNGKWCRLSTHCQSGWCEGSSVNKTQCSGVCRPKRKNGEAAWQSSIQLAPSCESNMQLCGTCVQGYGGVPNGKWCRLSSHCQSDWCEGSIEEGAACLATCEPKRANGQQAYNGYDASCISGVEKCNTCISGDGSNQIPEGNNCKVSADCQSGWCEGSTNDGLNCWATCQPKRENGQQAYNGWDSSCISGVEKCNTCVSGDGSNQLPEGYNCSKSLDCQSGWCEGSTEDGLNCVATCQPKRQNGEWAYNNWDDSCISGTEKCNTCVSSFLTSYNIPEGHWCSLHTDCESNNCRGSAFSCNSKCEP